MALFSSRKAPDHEEVPSSEAFDDQATAALTAAIEDEPLDSQATAALQSLEEEGAEEAGAPESFDDGASSAVEELPKPSVAPKKRRKRRRWTVVLTLSSLVVIAAVVAVSFFVWHRWYRADDSYQIQGVWYVVGTDVPIVVGPDTIEFTPDTIYGYTLDSRSKSLEFSLGNLTGQCRYWFIEDGAVLVIADGEGYSQWGSAAEDIYRYLQEFSQLSEGKSVQLPEGDGIIALARTPYYASESINAKDQKSQTSSNPSASGASDNSAGEDSQVAKDASENDPSGDSPSDSARDPFGSVSDRA